MLERHAEIRYPFGKITFVRRPSGRRFAFGGSVSDNTMLDDINSIQEDELVMGSLVRDDGMVVVIALVAFETQADADTYMDDIATADDLAVMAPSFH